MCPESGHASLFEVPFGGLWLTPRCPSVLTTYRDTQRVRDFVRVGTDPNPPVFAWGTHSHDCEQRVRAITVGRARWGTCGDQPSDSPVNQFAPKVAFYRRRWLPDPNAFANFEKREQSAFSIPPRHVSVRKTVLLGVRSKRFCELWGSLVNRGRYGHLACQPPGSGSTS